MTDRRMLTSEEVESLLSDGESCGTCGHFEECFPHVTAEEEPCFAWRRR